ncbi:MAG: PorT family protein [Bacteroidales bacterium]|nr:PorT family protein [Bacteroidales bacterium]
MMESSENMDRYYRDKLENYKESPPQDTWDIIADQLGHRRRRKMVIFISRIAAGLTILISLSVLYYYSQKSRYGGLAHQTVTTEGTETGQSDKDEVQSIENQTEPESKKQPVAVISRITSPERSVLPVTASDQTIQRTGQLSLTSDDDLFRGSSAPEDMTSTVIPVSVKISYLMPVACNHVEAGNPEYDRRLIDIDTRKTKQEPEYKYDHLPAFTEAETAEKERQTEWILGGQFAPLYSYRDLKPGNYQDYVKDQINSKEAGILAYAGGINLTVSPNKRLSVQSGIYYSRYGQEKNSLEAAVIFSPGSKNEIAETGWDEFGCAEITQALYIGNSTGKIMAVEEGSLSNNQSPFSYQRTDQAAANQLNPALPVSSVTQYFEYLEVPLNLKYKILDKKFDISLMGGISTNFLIGTDILLNFTDHSSKNTDYTTEGLKQINYSGLMGIGFEYPLFKNLILNVEPKFRYYVNSIDKEKVYNIHPYSIGIFSGISYVF